jgi:hypothetical protein
LIREGHVLIHRAELPAGREKGFSLTGNDVYRVKHSMFRDKNDRERKQGARDRKEEYLRKCRPGPKEKGLLVLYSIF